MTYKFERQKRKAVCTSSPLSPCAPIRPRLWDKNSTPNDNFQLLIIFQMRNSKTHRAKKHSAVKKQHYKQKGQPKPSVLRSCRFDQNSSKTIAVSLVALLRFSGLVTGNHLNSSVIKTVVFLSPSLWLDISSAHKHKTGQAKGRTQQRGFFTLSHTRNRVQRQSSLDSCWPSR